MPITPDLVIHPVCDIDVCNDVGTELMVVGGQPLFDLRPQGEVSAGGGWYLLSLTLRDVVRSGGCFVVSPVYSGIGGSGEEVELRQSGLRLECVVRLSHRLEYFRVALANCDSLNISEIRLRQIGKTAAAMKMVGDLSVAGLMNWSSFSAGLGGARRFGDELYRRYMGCRSATALPAPDSYQHWIRSVERRRGPADRQIEVGLISVLMPVYRPDVRWLRRAIESVMRQSYQNWELCIVDDFSNVPEVRAVIEELCSIDARIKVLFRNSNGHISVASNDALAMASGRFVALLDHDDELSLDALLEIAAAVNSNPMLRYIYSDEDKIDESGRRYDPYFKPDWNQELLLSQNYCCHLSAFDSTLIRDAGGFGIGFEGSQDHDLILRCTERLQAREIWHIPKILYHWRSTPESTAGGIDAKRYALDAGIRAISAHLLRTGQDAEVTLTADHYYRVSRKVPLPSPRVSLIMPTRDRVDLLRVAVSSILEKTDYDNFEIIVVNNQSRDPETLDYFEQLRRESRVMVLDYDSEFNYSRMNNFAAEQSSGEILCLINNDVEVINPEWLREMVSHAVRPINGVVGALLYYPDDTIQHAGVITGIGGVAGHVYHKQKRGHHGQNGRARLAQNMRVVTAACLVVRKSVFNQVGGLDPELRVAFNDVDFCLRVDQAGYRGVWTPFAELYHYESASRGYEDTPEKKRRFESEVDFMKARWGKLLDHDITYNPNLSLDQPFEIVSHSRT